MPMAACVSSAKPSAYLISSQVEITGVTLSLLNQPHYGLPDSQLQIHPVLGVTNNSRFNMLDLITFPTVRFFHIRNVMLVGRSQMAEFCARSGVIQAFVQDFVKYALCLNTLRFNHLCWLAVGLFRSLTFPFYDIFTGLSDFVRSCQMT